MAEMLAEDLSTEEEKARIRRDVFTTEAEAEERAEAIGCVGSHSHDEDGNIIYMPCKTHEEYIELTGRDVSGYKPKKPKKSDDDDFEHDYIEVASELKAIEDDDEEDEDRERYGRFEGYGAVFNNTDLGNDVLRNGAFRKSLRNRKPKNIKLLYQHKTDMPIGVFDSMKEDEHGLYVKGRLALQTQAGREAYELMKMGALDGLSIGFKTNPKNYSVDKRTRRRVIDEVDLMEVSLVTFPMNPKATVQMVKGQSISIREWENGLRDAFSISRSEAKAAAKAIHEAFTQRDVVEDDDMVEAIKTLTNSLKTVRK